MNMQNTTLQKSKLKLGIMCLSQSQTTINMSDLSYISGQRKNKHALARN